MEKLVKICDSCDLKISKINCPICEKDCCEDCFSMQPLILGNNLITEVKSCIKCHYTCRLIQFEESLCNQLVKDFFSNLKNITTVAHLQDETLESNVKKAIEENKRGHLKTQGSLNLFNPSRSTSTPYGGALMGDYDIPRRPKVSKIKGERYSL